MTFFRTCGNSPHFYRQKFKTKHRSHTRMLAYEETMNCFVNQVKVQQLFPLSIRVPNSNTKRIGLFQEKKISLKRRGNKVSSCTHQSDLPSVWRLWVPKVDSLIPLPSAGAGVATLGNFEGQIVKRRGPGSCWSLTQKFSNQVGCPEAARLLADSSQFVNKPKLILFDARETSKVKDELLGQRIVNRRKGRHLMEPSWLT